MLTGIQKAAVKTITTPTMLFRINWTAKKAFIKLNNLSRGIVGDIATVPAIYSNTDEPS
jgi:hypothetical protein